jgi:drug/metabolite transporter (DMT)-like permease
MAGHSHTPRRQDRAMAGLSHGAKVWIALGTVYVIWGSTYLAIAIAVEDLPPLLAVSTRFLAAGGILAAWLAWRRRSSLRISRRELGAAALVGVLLPGANAVLFFAERDVPNGLASLIIASVPLWVVLLRLLARERLSGTVVAGVLVGFAGVAVLLRPSGGATTLGLVLCLVSALMWATGSFLSGRVPLPRDPIAATSYEMLCGGAAMLPLGLATMGELDVSAGSAAAWVYLVVFGSLVGYTAYVWLLAHVPLSTVATYAYVNPVVAIALGFLFRDEELTPQILLGAAIVVASVAVVVRREAPAATPTEEAVR